MSALFEIYMIYKLLHRSDRPQNFNNKILSQSESSCFNISRFPANMSAVFAFFTLNLTMLMKFCRTFATRLRKCNMRLICRNVQKYVEICRNTPKYVEICRNTFDIRKNKKGQYVDPQKGQSRSPGVWPPWPLTVCVCCLCTLL